MIELVTLEEVKNHLRIDHDADDELLKGNIKIASAVLMAFIQGSKDKVVDEEGALIEGEALSRMKGSALRLVGILYRNPDGAEKEELMHGELPFAVTFLIYDLRCPTII